MATSLVKIELFQTVRRPPDAPREGTKENLSNHLGQHVIIKERSINGFFVSGRQTMEQPLVEIAFERAKCLSGEFKPRTFQ